MKTEHKKLMAERTTGAHRAELVFILVAVKKGSTQRKRRTALNREKQTKKKWHMPYHEMTTGTKDTISLHTSEPRTRETRWQVGRVGSRPEVKRFLSIYNLRRYCCKFCSSLWIGSVRCW